MVAEVAELNEWNQRKIAEFRANGGRVGGQFEGRPMLLLHNDGARTGTRRINPMTYQQVDEGYAVFATFGGASTHPAWYHNVVANPDVSIEVGTRAIDVRARVASGIERERIWARQKGDYPLMAEYEQRTNRTIPVVILEPRV
jgi:deazaflavin-dependent oxidoreductase (nitroreductase family)